MDLSEVTHPPRAVGDAPTAPMAVVAPPPATTYQQCEECAAPVDADQRYCVAAGLIAAT